ncbi:HAMP domain-containing histidine kinase [Candidatus Peregrinibacteria bacterium]|nr:HAMP domain-containing histidine kinase [Candidatus Peregrinibacteria bacterium]
MKLQAKLTLSFFLLILVVVVTSFLLLHWNFELHFNRFIDEKNQEWEQMQNGGKPGNEGRGVKNFFRTIRSNDAKIFILENEIETPEQKFLRTSIDSLIMAGMISMLIAAVLGFLLNKFLLRRIHGLQTSMHDYRDHNIVTSVSHGNEDEIDDLANIYNLLIQKIEKQENIRRDFFIDISHELRTPLTSIKGYLEGLDDKVFAPEKEKEIHQKIKRENERMIYLVKEMTSLAKLEAGQMSLNKKETDLHHLSDEVVEDFEAYLQERKLTVELTGMAKAHVDANKFKQVIINLLDNAITYSIEGSTIFIEMGKKDGQIFWFIKNSPSKKLTDEHELFFERFYRADKGRQYNKGKPHLGIGLNIVKKIIDQHKGNISVRRDGEQIVFEVTLAAD